MAADHRNGIINAVKRGKLLFQFTVERAFAGYEPTCRNRRSKLIDRSLRGATDSRIAIEAQIVIRGKVDHRLAANDSLSACPYVVGSEVGDIYTRRRSTSPQPRVPLLARQLRKVGGIESVNMLRLPVSCGKLVDGSYSTKLMALLPNPIGAETMPIKRWKSTEGLRDM